MTLEEFKTNRDRHPELPLKPVAEPVAFDGLGLEPDVLPIETAIPEPAIEEPAEVAGDQKTREAVVEESSTVAAALNPRESVVELAAELREPRDTNGTDIAPPHAA
jgi:hypothetical protein